MPSTPASAPPQAPTIVARLSELPSFAAASYAASDAAVSQRMGHDAARSAGARRRQAGCRPPRQRRDAHARSLRDRGPGARYRCRRTMGFRNRYSIAAPSNRSAIDWVLVPGVAFDRSGRRLGYGGGYYDRLLPLVASRTPRIVGAFDVQIVEHVPSGPHDITIDLIVTPTETIVNCIRASPGRPLEDAASERSDVRAATTTCGGDRTRGDARPPDVYLARRHRHRGARANDCDRSRCVPPSSSASLSASSMSAR